MPQITLSLIHELLSLRRILRHFTIYSVLVNEFVSKKASRIVFLYCRKNSAKFPISSTYAHWLSLRVEKFPPWGFFPSHNTAMAHWPLGCAEAKIFFQRWAYDPSKGAQTTLGTIWASLPLGQHFPRKPHKLSSRKGLPISSSLLSDFLSGADTSCHFTINSARVKAYSVRRASLFALFLTLRQQLAEFHESFSSAKG